MGRKSSTYKMHSHLPELRVKLYTTFQVLFFVLDRTVGLIAIRAEASFAISAQYRFSRSTYLT